MIALCWKELRENVKWSLLAMVGLGLAEFYALCQTSQGYVDYYYNDGVTLCKTAFLTVTTFGCAGIGMLLGLIQILPELKKDQWAALLHRPVTRGVVFRGKALAGLLLYLLATVPPFLLSVWYVATPGHFGVPFLPEMIKPGVADICAGAVYYFAAMAGALQSGGWMVLRVLPMLAAIYLTEFVDANKLFYVAVEAAVLMALAQFTAGWGIIANQMTLGARPWLGRFAFLAVVFYGVCGLGVLTKSFFDIVGKSGNSDWSRYELSDTGVPLRIEYSGQGIIKSVTDLDGKPLADPHLKPATVRQHMRYLNTFSSYIGNSHGWHAGNYRYGYREWRSYLWSLAPYQYPRQEQWFWLVKRRSFVGVLPSRHMLMGTLDRKGFGPVTAEPQPFPSKLKWTEFGRDRLLFWDDKNLRIALLPTREIVDLPLPAPGPIYGVSNAFASHGNGSVDVFGVTLSTGLAVYDDHETLLTTIPYNRDRNLERWGQISLGINATKDRFYLKYEPSEWIDGRTKGQMPSYVDEVDAQGNILKSYTLAPLPDRPHFRSWDDFLSQRLQSPAFYFGTMGYKKIGAWLGSKRLAGDLRNQFGHDRRLTQKLVVWVPIISLVFAVIALVWARRVHFSWRRAWAWAAFVFAFNLPGLITFRLAADWPQLVRCPGCPQSRPTREEECPHCGVAWPAPPRDGTEIFDRTTEAATNGRA